MVALNWSNLLGLGEGENVEDFLWNADIPSVILTLDPVRVKNTLFALIAKFEKYAGIQGRCFQLLQDCHLLSPPGIKDEELSPRFDAILRSLSSWIGKADVILPAFELLSMVSDLAVMKKRGVLVEDGQLLFFVNRAMKQHHNSVPLQRAALQLYEAIIEQTTDKRRLKSVGAKVFKPVLDNLILNDNNLSIASSSLSILSHFVDHSRDVMQPWTDQLTNIAISIISQHSSPEVISKSIILIDKLAFQNMSLSGIVHHERGIMIFVNVLTILDALHISAAIVSFELLLRILEDYGLSLAAFCNRSSLSPLDYAMHFRQELKNRFDHYLLLLSDLGEEKEEELQYLFLLYSNVEEIVESMVMSPTAEQLSFKARDDDISNGANGEIPQPKLEKMDSTSTKAVGPLSYEFSEKDEPICETPTTVTDSSTLNLTISTKQKNCHNCVLSSDTIIIEADILPATVKLSKSVPIALPNSIDCEILEDDVFLPDHQDFLSGTALEDSDEPMFCHNDSKFLREKLRRDTEGRTVDEMVNKMGRKPLPQRNMAPPKLLSNQTPILSDKSTINPDRKLIEEMHIALKFAKVQSDLANQRCTAMELLFCKAMKQMECLVIENEKLKTNLIHLSSLNNPMEREEISNFGIGNLQSRVLSNTNKLLEDSNISLGVGGLIEGLEFIGSLKAKTHDSDDDNHEIADDSEESPSNPLYYIDELEDFSSQISQLFNFILETYAFPDFPRRNRGVISANRLRQVLIKMNLVDGKRVDTRYLDFIFAYLDTNLFTVSRVAFILIYCGKKKFPSLSGIDLVRAVQEIVSIYLNTLTRLHRNYSQDSRSATLVAVPTLTDTEFKDLLIMLVSQETTFVTIFKAYASALKESTALETPNNLSACVSDEKRCVRHIAQYDLEEMACYFGESRKWNGLTFQDTIQFAKDFQICPKLISRLELHQFFFSVACEGTVTHSKNTIQITPPFSFYLDNDFPVYHDRLDLDMTKNLAQDDHSDEVMSRSECDEDEENGIDRLSDTEFLNPSLGCDSRDDLLQKLKLEVDEIWKSPEGLEHKDKRKTNKMSMNHAIVSPHSMTINFLEFLDIIVLIASRSSIFHNEGSLLSKVNSLLDLMNMSSGKVYLSRRLQGLYESDSSPLEFQTSIEYAASQDDIFVDMSRSHSSNHFASVFDEIAETYGVDSSQHHFDQNLTPCHGNPSNEGIYGEMVNCSPVTIHYVSNSINTDADNADHQFQSKERNEVGQSKSQSLSRGALEEPLMFLPNHHRQTQNSITTSASNGSPIPSNKSILSWFAGFGSSPPKM